MFLLAALHRRYYIKQSMFSIQIYKKKTELRVKNYKNTSSCTYLYPPLKTNMRFVLYPFKRCRTFIKMFKHIYAYKILGNRKNVSN